ncbi:MAG TPA: response regulator transcription factor [Candidatus Paceibacterota bacterium]|jgi:DNA-binding response OmpR family regulator
MRILVVEDEQKIREFLKESLEAEFLAVDAVEDGETGSRLARTNDYDLVILDNLLPKKEGLEVCREIRADGKKMPILIVSVKNDTVNKVDLLDAGADDYLTKPFALPELLARVRALLRRPAAMEGESYTADTLVLDSRTGAVTRDGKDIRLTRKEFMLLQYLLQNKGTVLSRGMILEHVWDMSVDIFSNTIESHILSLRKKIMDTGGERIILTVPGRGYKIAEN